MPTRVHPPACLLEVFDDYLFPTIDFSRVAFFTGMPLVFDRGQGGFTLPASGFGSQINVYVSEKVYDPCGFESFLVVAHELVHVLQIQESLFGGRIPGWWAGKYAGCWLGWLHNGSGCDNRLEREAYEYANGCDAATGGALRTCLIGAGLAQAPCDCSDRPWYHRSFVPGTTVTFYDQLQRACPDLVKKGSTASTWRCLVSPWAFVVAVVVGIVVGIVSVIVQIIRSLIDWVGGIFGGSKSWIWFTASGGTDWYIPDAPVTRNDHTKTSAGPAVAVFDGGLYMAYKGAGGSDNLFYNVFDGQSWLDEDIRITRNDHTKTSAGPALAVFGGRLYMAYKGAGGSDNLFYNVFDGQSWLDEDIRITRNDHTKTSAGPALAVFGGRLYMAYKGAGGSDNLFYNVFDGQSWLDEDIRITRNDHTKTSAGPALAVFGGRLYMAYKGAGGSDNLFYNVFDGQSWLDEDIRITRNDHTKTSAGPALAVFGGRLYMAYKGAGGSDNLFYNVFDGQSWLDEDIRITRYGSVHTARSPALAGFDQLLYLIYRDNS